MRNFNRPLLSVALMLGAGFAAATILAAEAISAEKTAAVTVDAIQVGAPISKYIYGQFIEHLGRCIYGGIWAEMLEDRKFCYPVGDRESPWKALGDASSLTMDANQPFVGKHTPALKLSGDKPTGLCQGGLGIRKGMSYVGSIWLAGDPEAGPVTVRLVWGTGQNENATVTIDKVTPDFAKTALQFTAGSDTDDARLEIVAQGKGTLKIGAVSLMPGDNIQGMRRRHAKNAERVGLSDLSLAGRELRERLRLARRHRRPRSPPAAEKSGLERTGAQRFRHR